MERTDSELVADSLAGRPDAFAEVVRRHAAAVHGYLARRVGRESANDLLGEIWLRAFRNRHGYDLGSESIRPWLYGIARNCLREYWRSGPAEAPGGTTTTDPWPDVDERLSAVAARAALRTALATLDPDDRDVLLLVAGEHLTPAEVAMSLGIPGGTARWRLHRARRQLHALLSDHPTSSALAPRPKEA